MKILHIVYNCIPGRYRGGIPKMVAELSHEQYKLGHQVFIYTTDYNLYVKETVPYNEDVVFNGAKIRFFRGFLHPCWRSPELTRHEERQIRRLGISSPVHVVPNGIEPVPEVTEEARSEFRRRHRLEPDVPVLLYLGRFVPKKGVDLLLHAFARSRAHHPNVVL